MPPIPKVLERLGLSKNEAKVYETMLREGESSVGNLAIKSRVHRRNVYDTLNHQQILIFSDALPVITKTYAK